GKEEVAALLLNKEANVNAKDQIGRTPLHFAAENGHKDVVEFLLSNKADVNAVNKYEWTPLHFAAGNGHKEVVEALLKVEGINVNATDQSGWTPLHWTRIDEIKTLLQNAEKTDPVDESSTDSKGDQEEEPAQTEEHSSSLFDSLFSILMKPFSLIASFFGGFFSWLFGSNEEKADEFTDDTLLKLDSSDKEKTDLQSDEDSEDSSDNHLFG
ncbi:MAG: ankyrin repeat domain-containing protein, partial [Wolbachia sp.]